MGHAIANGVLVGVGGFAGSIARYGVTLLMQGHSLVLPAGTLLANLAGCFLVGCVAQWAVPVLSPEARLLLATGFCGGFTTLSSAVYETAQLLREGEYVYAGGYVVLTLAGSFALFFAGAMLMKMVFRGTGGVWS